MLNNYLVSFGQYCSSFFYALPTAAEQRTRLQQALLQHVANNNHEAIRALLIDNHAEEWTGTDEMTFAYSLLHNAIEQGSVQAFEVLVDKLPLDVLKMCTGDTGQTLPMLTVRAEQTAMLRKCISTLCNKTAAQYNHFLPHSPQTQYTLATVDFRAVIDAQDRDGNTALIHAVFNGHEPSVDLLCIFLASTLIWNDAGDSVLSLIANLPDDDALAHRVRRRHTLET